MYNIRNGAMRLQMHDFHFYGNCKVCSISHHLGDICKSNKIPKICLEKGQGHAVKNLRYSTENVRIRIGDFFSSEF